MINNFSRRSLAALIFTGALGITSSAFAEEQMMNHKAHMEGMGQMGEGMGMAHHGDGKKSWGDGGSPMGMESGHMTARLRAVWNLDLTAEQKKQIRDIQKALRTATFEHEDAIEMVSDKLFDLYKAEKRDAKAIGKVYGEIFGHRQSIIEAQIEAGNKVEAVLTKEQYQSLKSWGQKPKWGAGWGK